MELESKMKREDMVKKWFVLLNLVGSGWKKKGRRKILIRGLEEKLYASRMGGRDVAVFKV